MTEIRTYVLDPSVREGEGGGIYEDRTIGACPFAAAVMSSVTDFVLPNTIPTITKFFRRKNMLTTANRTRRHFFASFFAPFFVQVDQSASRVHEKGREIRSLAYSQE